MQHVNKLNGYEIQSSTPLPNTVLQLFHNDIGMLMKPYIKQYFYHVIVEKEWGISLSQLYEQCINKDLIAFGLNYYRGGVVLSVVGNRKLFNIQKYYHQYREIKQLNSIFIVFPISMILSVDVVGSCELCKDVEIVISNHTHCSNIKCKNSNIYVQPRDLKFGNLVLSLEEVIMHTFNKSLSINHLKMSCKYCRNKKVHKICSYNKHARKIQSIKDSFF